MSSFQAWIAEHSLRIHQGLVYYLENISYPAQKLQESMAYATLNGGKRVRSLLIYATGKIFAAPLENLDLAALAIECIHSYSLIHDDLPAMDNAKWRRGKLACHRAFGESLAILAGDALQPLAFEIIASHPAPLSATKRLRMVQILSRASGPSGLVSGQTWDLQNTDKLGLSENELIQLYQLKTGVLIEASIHLGLTAAAIKDRKLIKALEKYAKNLGLAFQIQDDILDLEKNEEETGKSTGLDQKNQKTSYPLLVGLDAAKKKVSYLFDHAFQALDCLGQKADFLRQLTEYVAKREK